MSILLGLVAVSGDWRSPFCLLSLTTLAAPAASLGVRRAVLVGPLAMRNRARTIGGRLTVERGANGRGTMVSLHVSANRTAQASS